MDKSWNITEKILLTVCGFTVAAGLLVLYFSTPGKSWYLPQCTFFRLTGFYCPGCGATRSLHALLHGDILRAVRNNLLLLPLLAAVPFVFLRPKWFLNRTFAFCFLGIFLLFFILRNLPFAPFTHLAPQNI